MGKDRTCRPTSDIPGNIAREVPAMRSKANEAVINVFIGANVAPKILLTSNNLVLPENTGLDSSSGFYPELPAAIRSDAAEPVCSPKDKNENHAR